MDWDDLRATTLNRPDSLALALERLILSGDLATGAKLPPERTLSEQLGVSRASLRDALRDLEVRNLISRKPGTGTVVLDPGDSADVDALVSDMDPSMSSLMDVLDVRGCIEPPVTARAAQRATRLEILQLENLISEMRLRQSPKEFAELDRTFHRAIARYTHNPFLPRLLDRISEIIELSRDDSVLTEERQMSSLIEHTEIVEAIAARDSKRAFDASERHIISIRSRLRAQSHNHE